jgi:hypothetical protein
LGWDYGRILGGIGGKFSGHTRFEMEDAPMLDYGMIYGVEIWPLRKPFKIYMVNNGTTFTTR